MDTNKKKIYSGTSNVKAMGIKNALENEGITYYEFDQTDSAYGGLFKQIDIFVAHEDEVQALELIKNFIN